MDAEAVGTAVAVGVAVADPSPAEAGSSRAEVDPNPVEAADPNLAVPAEGPRTVEAVPTGDPNRRHPEAADSNSAEAADSNHRSAGIGLRLLHPYR